MTQTEVTQLLAIVKAAYPQTYRGMSVRDANATVALWADMFADHDAVIVGAALKAYIASDKKGFAPSPGQILDKLQLMTDPDGGLTEQAAWALVKRAVKNGLYGYREEWDKLPREVQSVVHDPAVLREWAMIPEDELDTVIASNFQRSYRAVASRRREVEKIPASVRALVAEYTGGLKLEWDADRMQYLSAPGKEAPNE